MFIETIEQWPKGVKLVEAKNLIPGDCVMHIDESTQEAIVFLCLSMQELDDKKDNILTFLNTKTNKIFYLHSKNSYLYKI